MICLGKTMALEDRINALIEDRGQMSAAEITKALHELGELPPYWTVLDVADFCRKWFSGNT